MTGGPGAGKSALLDYVASSADEAEIIRIEGLQSEAEIGLAGLHRLLLFHPERRSVLPAAQPSTTVTSRQDRKHPSSRLTPSRLSPRDPRRPPGPANYEKHGPVQHVRYLH